MALTTCPECGKEVSNQAPACPNCGYPLSPAQHDASQPEPTAQHDHLFLQTPTVETKARNKKILFGVSAVVASAILIFAIVCAVTPHQESELPAPTPLQFWERDQNEVLDAISQRIQDQTFFPENTLTVVIKETGVKEIPQHYIQVDGKTTSSSFFFEENENTRVPNLCLICPCADDDDSITGFLVAVSAIFCECDTLGNFPTMDEGNDVLREMIDVYEDEPVSRTIGGVRYELMATSVSLLFQATKSS